MRLHIKLCIVIVLIVLFRPIPASRIAPPPPSSFDLLDTIFKEQSLLHMNSADVLIQRDGKSPALLSGI